MDLFHHKQNFVVDYLLLFRDFLYIQCRWWSDGQTHVFIDLLWLTECLKLVNHIFRSNVIRLLKFWLINRVDFDFSGVLIWDIIQLINISDLAKFISPNNWINIFLEHMCLIRKNTNNKTASTIRKKTKHMRRFFHMHWFFRSNVLKIASQKNQHHQLIAYDHRI